MTPTRQDALLLAAGFVRPKLVAEALGVAQSTVLTRIKQGRYRSQRSGNTHYVNIESVRSAEGTSEPQKAELDRLVGELTEKVQGQPRG